MKITLFLLMGIPVAGSVLFIGIQIGKNQTSAPIAVINQPITTPTESPIQTISQSERSSDWPWSEYPPQFKGVDCNTVPENSVGWPPGNDIPQSFRKVCWKERIWFENNWKLCEFVNENPKSRCYQIMVAKLNNDEICNHPDSGIEECKKYLEKYREGAFGIKSLIEEDPSYNPL